MTPNPLPDRSGTLREAGSEADRPVVGFRIVLAVLAGMAFSGRPVPTRAAEPPRAGPSYETDVRPLLEAKCLRCHGPKVQKAELDLSAVATILRGGESGPVVVPGKPEESTLYEMVHDGSMPADKSGRLGEAEVDVLKRWIEAGAGSGPSTVAEGPAPSAPEVTQHDVIPVLLRRCTVCHGLRQQEGGLDLRTKASMLKGGKSGPAFVAGKPDESLVIRKIRDGSMPPRRRVVEVSIKPIEAAETDLLTRWIERGAPEARVEPDVAGDAPDPLVTDKDREFWAFQAPKAVEVPSVKNAERVRNPIDAFILRTLEQGGLGLSPEADRLTLLRRVSFDLTGLPPEPDEVDAFVADRRPDAYEAMVDRLLASPGYGERWGRRWLDLAGYADSEGKREQDLPRPFAYRYRDYVIRALNEDKPYDRFLVEQIAGDELLDYEHAPRITPEIYDNLVATGFLRMAPDSTWANITGFLPDRVEVVSDEIDVLGSAVMGITLKCARCHTHKFDPIPHRDYYRLVAVFKGAYDEYDWLKPEISTLPAPLSFDTQGDRHLPHVLPEEREAWKEQNAPVQREIDALKSALSVRADALAKAQVEARLAKLPEVLRDDLRSLLATSADKRNSVQVYLAGKFEKELRIGPDELKTLDAGFKAMADETAAKVKALEAKRPPEPKIRALWDRGEPSPTYIARRGDPMSPGRLVGPGVPSMLTDGKTPFEVRPPWPGARSTGRRLAFARWLTRPDHPLTARVVVNRLWKGHFGAGIVPTLDNLGKAGARPTHPELLDWLALELVEQGWSLKAMHRLMVTSATYRQDSAVSPELDARDPENTLYSRMPLTRLDAEALYDTLLAVAGRLDGRRFGPPDPVQARADGLVSPVGTETGWRRSIYVSQTRKQVVTLLEDFDLPQMNPNCSTRRDSTVAPQALHLMNNAMIQTLAEGFARRVKAEVGDDSARQVEGASRIAFGRPPSDEEKTLGVAALTRLTGGWRSQRAVEAKPGADDSAARGLASYCHAILNSANFLYVD